LRPSFPSYKGLFTGFPIETGRRIVSVALSLTVYYYNAERPLAVNAHSLVARTFLTHAERWRIASQKSG